MAEVLSDELQEGAFRVGFDLANPVMPINLAVKQLNINLATIGCDPTVDTDYVQGPWQSELLIPGSPPFTRALRQATSTIIWRPESLADTLPPINSRLANDKGSAIWIESADKDIGKTVMQSTEGAVWLDATSAEQRVNFAERNAALLRGVLGGLAAHGYARSKAKIDMQQEFDEILDGLWRRGSYHCFSESKVVASMMRKAGLASPTGSVKAIKRFRAFGKDYGYGLAIQRLLPDSVLAELE